jgi:DNA-binding NarL/FixJ family response regulator
MPSHAPITVVLAHFDDLFAGGLRKLIESDSSLLLVADDVQHRRMGVVLRAHRPDVAILDIRALAKLAEVRELSNSYPATRLLLLGHDLARVECAQALAFGASACLGRDTQSRDLINAIHLASRGPQVIPRAVGDPGAGLLTPSTLLTRREVEVLPLLRRGDSNAQIALALGVGVETVRTHARNIYRKLGVRTRRELAASPADQPDQRPRRDVGSPQPRRDVGSPRARTPMPHRRARRGHGVRHP